MTCTELNLMPEQLLDGPSSMRGEILYYCALESWQADESPGRPAFKPLQWTVKEYNEYLKFQLTKLVNPKRPTN